MTANPLKAVAQTPYESRLTAAEWAAIAREGGHFEQSKAWDRKAEELGEQRIPNGITVRFTDSGEKVRVWLREG